jgi:hypothetical protein
MLQVKRYLLVFSVLLFAACNAVTQLFQATQIPVPTPTAPEVTDTPLPPTATLAPTATATETMTPSPSRDPSLSHLNPRDRRNLDSGIFHPRGPGDSCSPANHGSCHRGGKDAGVFHYITFSMPKSF